MSDFKTRLQEEYDQLSERLTKLNAFLQTPQLNELPSVQQDLLKKQAIHMTDYHNVLNERLALLNKDAEVSSTFGNDQKATTTSQHDPSLSNTPYGPEGKPAGQSGESEAGSNQAQS